MALVLRHFSNISENQNLRPQCPTSSRREAISLHQDHTRLDILLSASQKGSSLCSSLSVSMEQVCTDCGSRSAGSCAAMKRTVPSLAEASSLNVMMVGFVGGYRRCR